MKGILRGTCWTILVLFILGSGYALTLCFPQPFYAHNLTVGNITVYSDELIPEREMTDIIQRAEDNIRRSVVYKKGTRHRIFITNDHLRWMYFTNKFYKVGGLNYTVFNHNIFLRKADIRTNRLYGASGNAVPGDRTLDYFIAHEMTHTLEFESMPWYRYPINTNWTLEGYAEYVAHGSQPYESALQYYLNVPESSGAKNYTRMRVMVTYLLEKEKVPLNMLWEKSGEYNTVLKKAIPEDKPNIVKGNPF